MAAVYLARQERLGGRLVALKVLPPHVAHSPMARARFKSEILALAKQHHPGVVPAYDVIEEGSALAYTMEWIDGRTLEQVIEQLRDSPEGLSGDVMDRVRVFLDTPAWNPLEAGYWGFIARIGSSVARALQTVHESGILHRDIKPSNILIRRDGTPMLSDFGLAKALEGPGLTLTMSFLGTPVYAPPEQLRGLSEDLTAKSDLYSLGATLHHALTLRPPFNSGAPQQVIAQIETGEADRALRASPEVPRELATIVGKAMASDPARRYENAAHLADDLERFLRREPVQARPEGPMRRAALAARRSRQILIAAVAGAGLALAVGWAVVSSLDRRRPIAAVPPTVPQPFGAPWRLEDARGTSGDHFGTALAGFGDRVIVGSPEADPSVSSSIVTDAGIAIIFRLDAGQWVEEARLSAPDASVAAAFGAAVSLGDDLAVVGAHAAMSGGKARAGAFYLFRRAGSGWAFVQRVQSPSPSEDVGLGYCLALAGQTLAVGSIWNGEPAPGLIYRVSREGAQLVHAEVPAALSTNSVMTMSCDVGCEGDLVVFGFGWSDTVAGDNAGSAYVYAREAPGTDRWRLAQTIIADDMHPHANFGTSVAVATPMGVAQTASNTVIAGAMSSMNAGSVPEAGAVRIFAPVVGMDGAVQWKRAADLRPPTPGNRDFFGTSMAMRGSVLVVRDFTSTDGIWRHGAVQVFQREAGAGPERWEPPVRLAPTRSIGDEFGSGVSLWSGAASGEMFLGAGARLVDGTEKDAGAGADRGAAWVWRVKKNDRAGKR
jgi:hypothetical protein